MSHPVILAIDTSGHHCAAALCWGDGSVATTQEDMAKGQAERLMTLLEELLAQEKFVWADLDAIAVGVGPGNFTGIRIAVAAARGLALGLGIPAIGISNFEVLRGSGTLTDLDRQEVRLPGPRGSSYVQEFADGGPTGAPYQDQSPDQPGAGILSDIPQTMVRIAAAKWAAGLVDGTPPAPLYVRSPDAAPPRDAAPVLLP